MTTYMHPPRINTLTRNPDPPLPNVPSSNKQGLMPGGVSSPVRAFRSVGGNPIVFDKVKGAYAWDVDGNKYIDYVGSWGPAIVGHADDEVLKVLGEVAAKGESVAGLFACCCYVRPRGNPSLTSPPPTPPTRHVLRRALDV